jgi:ribonuclease J
MIAPHKDDELVFLPLGGCNEIGMNLNAYGYGPPDDRKWIIVDVGVTFAGLDLPGIDLITPDVTYLEAIKSDILAIILTHAHEDHIGAIAHLWPRLKAPIYATPFTAYLVREKLKEKGLEAKAKVTVTPLGGALEFGPFQVRYITLTHSIPEPNGLAIKTPLGTVWHTGDWKIDPEPMIGATTDTASVTALGEDGLLAMVCDSTNVFVEGSAGSEGDVRKVLADLIAQQKGKVAVTAFASNVARVESTILAGEAAGRQVCLVGRSMHRIVGAAKSVGMLKTAAPFIGEEEASYLEGRRVLYLCTGSQGEPRAALTRIAMGDHRHVRLGEGDTVIFSSRVIPGNEVGIFALYNELAGRGVKLITEKQFPVHVSGHPAREELKEMYGWARPQIAIPVHGERRHLIEHAALARQLQTPQALSIRNGDIVRLAPGPAAVIDEAPSGRLYVDGSVLIEEGDDALRERKRLAADGLVTVMFVIGGKKRNIVAGPDVRARGLSAADDDEFETALDEIARTAEAAYTRLSPADRADEDTAEAAIVKAARKTAERVWGKRPHIEAVIVALD